ncbi:TerC/Alx family metal homeostasis membrane protein [Trueperella sp. LYQ143]|uniref:TerC/Alx family metal homeostasis membrane protein n=1 Tax=unclassified Trueperella TaxID=2630174 RepID=UPI003983B97A
MVVHPWEWLALIGLVVAMIAWDLLGHVRKPHDPTIKEAALWSSFYISLAVIFGVVVYLKHSPEFAAQYFAGYLTEISLSIDNIFVFIIIIAAFRVPRIYQQKVLMWGIVVALLMRFVFIIAAATIIEKFAWTFFIFGAWMLYTAIVQVRDGIEEEKNRNNPNAPAASEEYEPNFVTRLASRVFRVTDGYVGQRLAIRRGGKTWVTPLLMCVISIGSIDLMFALDSIPAIYGLTSEPFIVFAANAFALSGLRQLFFLVDGLLDRLIYLHFGLAMILGFISLKLILHACHGVDVLTAIHEPSPLVSTMIIMVIIIVTVIASIIGARHHARRVQHASQIGPFEPTAMDLGEQATGKENPDSATETTANVN